MARQYFPVDTTGNLTTSLVSYWKLGDLTDSYGSNTLTNVNGVSFTTGKIDRAGSFARASSRYLKTSSVITSATTNFSVCAWVYVTSATTSRGCVFTSGVLSGFSFGIGGNDGTGLHTSPHDRFDFDGNYLLALGSAWMYFGSNVGTGWHHIAVTRGASTWKGYIDGVLCPNTFTTSCSAGSTASLIGGRNTSAINSAYFDDLICELAVFSGELSQQNITDLVNGMDGETLLTAYNVLSKNTTYKKMMDIVRPRMNMLLDWKLSDKLLIKEINDAVSRYYAVLRNKKRYSTRFTFNITGSGNPYSIDLSALNPFPSKIDTVIYTGDGRVPIRMLPPVELENVSSLSSVNSNSVFGALDGQSLALVFGSDVTLDTSASVEVVLLRQPDISGTVSNMTTQYLDVADEDIDTIADMVCDNITYYRN